MVSVQTQPCLDSRSAKVELSSESRYVYEVTLIIGLSLFQANLEVSQHLFKMPNQLTVIHGVIYEISLIQKLCSVARIV